MNDPLIYLLAGLALIIFMGMFALAWRALSIAHDLAKIVLQAGLTPQHPAVVQPSAPVPAPTPTTAPVRSKPPATSTVPVWFQSALREVGFHETGNNQGIERYINLAHTGKSGDPWCAIFANAMLESNGIPGTKSAVAKSFITDPNFVPLAKPALGCIAVFWRGSKSSTTGHVGFYYGENDTRVWTLGGNEDNMVQIEALPKDSPSFGLIGYWWPKSVALPTGGPVIMPASAPVQVQTPSTDTGTEFGTLVPGGYFSSSPYDKTIPASIRTNNPGALNVAPWIKTFPGYVGDKVTSMSGTEPNSTVIFSTPEHGVAAWYTLMEKYHTAGATTLSAIINRYGGGQDYSNYIAEVAAWSGLGEQAEINLDDDKTLLPFAKAMFRYEAGRPSPLSDAQILYGFNLARRATPSTPVPPTTT